MNWEQLVTPNKYDEWAVADVQDLVVLFEKYVARRGVELAIEPSRIVTHILKYIYLRQTSSMYDIAGPRTTPMIPRGWTPEDEEIWNEWISTHCTTDSWEEEVLRPIFGSDIRLWEAACERWRLEITYYFTYWIKRSPDIVDKFNPTLLESEDEEEGNTKIVDSYIMDHGSAKQKKAAMRSGL